MGGSGRSSGGFAAPILYMEFIWKAILSGQDGISDLTDGFGDFLVDRVFKRYQLMGCSGG